MRPGPVPTLRPSRPGAVRRGSSARGARFGSRHMPVNPQKSFSRFRKKSAPGAECAPAALPLTPRATCASDKPRTRRDDDRDPLRGGVTAPDASSCDGWSPSMDRTRRWATSCRRRSVNARTGERAALQHRCDPLWPMLAPLFGSPRGGLKIGRYGHA